MRYIVDDIGAVVQRVLDDPNVADLFPSDTSWKKSDANTVPFYMYGHMVEIAKRLTKKDGSADGKEQKYPLFILLMDIKEHVENLTTYPNITILIVTSTRQEYIVPERMQKVFKPVLYPLYESFLKQLKDSGLFLWEKNLISPERNKTDHPFWGKPKLEKNEALPLNDTLDCIELEIFNLKSTNRC